MDWPKSNYEHQLYYRWLLDQLETRWLSRQMQYIGTPLGHPEMMRRVWRYERARRNYYLVKRRYDRVRFEKRWFH